MDNQIQEVYQVQNPALGATILWRFVCGYKSVNYEPVPFSLLFLVLPIIYKKNLCTTIYKTQRYTGLSKVSEKLFKEKRNDELYSINNSAIALRAETLRSFNIGLSTNLYYIDTASAMVYPLSESRPDGLSSEAKMLLDSAEKLGAWCGEMSLTEICEWLKVRF
ncbi:MAG: hypothetical protein K2G44_00315 [Clostridia bacterium]|nr:hypothetical protein [Clostridia bacterium]